MRRKKLEYVSLEQDGQVMHLLPKKRMGILGILFSRFGLVMLLILMEIGILFSAFRWFAEYFQWFTVVQTLFTLAMVLYLFNCGMDSSAKLTWLCLIMLFPVPASLFLWFTQTNIGHRAEKSRIEKLIKETKEILEQDQEIINKPVLIQSGTDDLCRYLNRSGCFPIYENTEVFYFPYGEDEFSPLLEELKKAEHFIFLEYFIINEGRMWGSILKILADKAASGVDVRVMYDAMCEITLLSSDYPKRLERLGIRCKPFAELHPFMSSHYNYRDHRKILVIDGKVAFNGGVNLSDEYINHVQLFGRWKDTAVMLRGEAVQSFTLMFLQMWNMVEANVSFEECKIRVPSNKTDGFVMPFSDQPLDGDKVGESVYMDILYRAKTYVHVMTPYLILDNEMETAIKYAAQRGVEVKLILPGVPDKKIPYALAKSHYKSLLEAGVGIYEYVPGFVHAKVFVSDDEKAVVGTINLDYRSLYHHFECATYLYGCSCIQDVEADFEETLAQCRRVTMETVKRENVIYRAVGSVMKILAPLM